MIYLFISYFILIQFLLLDSYSITIKIHASRRYTFGDKLLSIYGSVGDTQ